MLPTLRRGARATPARSLSGHTGRRTRAPANQNLPVARWVRRLGAEAKGSDNGSRDLWYKLTVVATICGAGFTGWQAKTEWQQMVPKPTLLEALQAPQPAFNLDGHHLVGREPFLNAIGQCFEDSAFGVYVVWAPAQSGKTNYTAQVAEAWANKSTKRHWKKIKTYDAFVKPNDLLVSVLNVADASALEQQLAEVDREVVIVLDQFGEAFQHFDPGQLQSFVVGLAQASQHGKNFRVLVNVQDPDVADVLLAWNGGEKIFLCGEVPRGSAQDILHFKWQEDEARKFLEGVGPEWTEEDKKLFAEAACKGSNIAKLKRMKEDRSLVRDAGMWQRLDVDAAKWTSGVACLSTRVDRQLAALQRRDEVV